MIQTCKLETVNNQTILTVYLDTHAVEFSAELGRKPGKKEDFHEYIQNYVKQKFPNLKVNIIKVMSGSLLVSSFYISGGGQAQANTATTSAVTVTQAQLFDIYTVKSGDTLSLIAKNHRVSVQSIKEVNGLQSDLIFVGQQLRLPYVSHTVQSGESLFLIAKGYASTVSEIRTFNQLTGDVIFPGQVLRIPRTVPAGGTINEVEAPTDGQVVPAPQPDEAAPAPAPTEPEPVTDNTFHYTVVAGDSLSVIAKRFGTSVDAIRSLNQLTSDLIRVGQVLLIPAAKQPDDKQAAPAPAPTEPEPVTDDTFHYTVVAGDSLSVIAKRFGTSVDAIRSLNQLTSDLIRVGQVLLIPAAKQPDDKQAAPAPQPDEAAPAPAPTEPEPVMDDTFHYTVVAGDSLSVIAKRFDTSVDAIRSLNQLASDLIRVGQILLIPEKTAPAPSVEEAAEPPEIANMTTLPPISQENAAAYLLEGQTDRDAIITVVIDDGIHRKTTTVTSNEQGQFSLTLDLHDFVDGEISFELTAENKVGEKGETLRTTVIKDTVIDIPQLETAEFVNDKNQHSFRLIGTAKPNATVLVSITDEEEQEVTAEVRADQRGNYITEVNLSSLTDSTLLIRVRQRDDIGNISQVNLLFVEKITAVPAAPVVQYDGYVNNQNEQLFTITGTSSALATILFTIRSESGKALETTVKADSDGNYLLPLNLSGLEDGPLTLEVQQKDKAGNFSETTTQFLVKNTVEPPLSYDLPNTIYSGNVNDFVLSGTSSPDSTVTIKVGDGASTITNDVTTDENGLFALPFDMRYLKDGELTVTVFAVDKYGNKGKEQHFSVKKDTIAPEAIAIHDLGYVNSNNKTNYFIRGFSEEDGAAVVMRISDGTNNLTDTAIVTDGEFGFTVDLSGFRDGPLTVELHQRDAAGNESKPTTLTVEKDTFIDTPLITRSGYVISGNELVYTISGTAEPFSLITITIGNEADGEPVSITHKVNERGIFSIDVSMANINIAEMDTLSVTQTDIAGNTSEMVTPVVHSYIVAPGDTLSQIAKRFHTTIEAIRNVNGISGDMIFPDQMVKLPINASETINLGYLFFGDPKHFTNQVLATERSFNTVSPSYFDVNPDGTLKVTAQFDPVFVQNMHAQGIRVVPFLSNHWDREIGRAMLHNREQATRQIVDFVIRNNLDGVNVDIENITHADREHFTDFVRLLREKMPSSKEVSVAVAANPNGWTQGWHGAYDYRELAKYADYLMIMTYDESYYGGPPGPVASLPWVERSIQYAISQGVPKNKIVIGLAHYGRFWREGSTVGGHGISNAQIQEMLRKYEHTITFDQASQSVKAVVTIRPNDPKTYIMGAALEPGTYTIWYENDDSYRAKVALVQKYGIKGVGHWSIGQENRDVWNSYHTWFGRKDLAEVPAAPAEPEKNEAALTTYTVVSGDSLFRIALRFNTTIDAIKAANNLTGDMIFVGQILKIPNP
ncbi:Spore germination protein YaaH [Evansella caseinilytica]|uniref:Spore germination protein YaaH n=1 Tax=Evansella caseinilytica TaxID=1503961 RepID=A0A1H3RCU9_9BACI|nr:LysM peptidoglycan-binding domain-containing protein [Evansella caseinilytica]SDZ23363.1 Spore germination protein YaaH [Evansella caseinilytica]